jgi:glycosyltransferase involved in cell wall biosynthesis
MIPHKPRVLYGLETKRPLEPNANYLRLEGWGFVVGGTATPKSRLCIGGKNYAPKSTCARPDVAADHPEDPQAGSCGFEFLILLPCGLETGILELSGDDGESWHKACDLMIPITPHPLMGAFEPAGENGIIRSPTRLAGWCWHPELEISEVLLLQGDTEVAVDWNQERPDVAARFPAQPAARYSGFITTENLPRGRGKIRLQITTTCGRYYFIDPKLEARIEHGAYAKPRDPPEMWELSLPSAPTPLTPESSEKISAGKSNILFVLHGNFTANSASHVTALANELIAEGYDCIVAVPENPETIGAQPSARFLVVAFDELEILPQVFRDGCGPCVTHIWSPRERMRRVWERIETAFETKLVIHLEDNDHAILADHLKLEPSALAAKTVDELDERVGPDFVHPIRGPEFMRRAAGATLIFESLAQLLPPAVPSVSFWPAATPVFSPQPPAHELRARLGIADSDYVLFYHGNTHDANTREVGELYRAVAALNELGQTCWLIRTGRDLPSFAAEYDSRLGHRLIHLGFQKNNEHHPRLMAMADCFVQPGLPGDFNDFRFPSKLPEFFAIGRPVILPASNLGHHITSEVDALVLPRADAASIAQAVQRLIADPELARRLATGATAFAQKHFSWPRSAAKLRDFYHQVTDLEAPDSRQVAAAELLNASLQRRHGKEPNQQRHG